MEKTLEQLREERNEIVREWDRKMQPLRAKRSSGEALTADEWDKWDEYTNEMQMKVAMIDEQIFMKGGME